MRNGTIKRKIKRILKRVVKRGGAMLLCVFITAGTIHMNALAAEDTLAVVTAATIQDSEGTPENMSADLREETPAQTNTPPHRVRLRICR